MALETASYIDGLSTSDPKGLDSESQGDDHLRLIKKVLKQTFPNYTKPVDVTPDMLNEAFAEIIAGNVTIPSGGLTDAAFTALGTSTGEIPTADQVELKGDGGAPIGSIYMWPLATPPSKHLVCDGSEINRTTYADLFAVYGTTFGAGDGTNTFNLPDWRSRKPLGAGQGSGLTNRSLNATGGEEEHTLTLQEIPRDGFKVYRGNNSAGRDGNTGYAIANDYDDPSGGPSDGGMTESTTAVKGGDDQPHNNMDPWVATNFIVRAEK